MKKLRKLLSLLFLTVFSITGCQGVSSAISSENVISSSINSTSEETPNENLSEWTFMFYVCGSTLEEDSEQFTHFLINPLKTRTMPTDTNLVFEVGGTKYWGSNSFGVDFDPTKNTRFEITNKSIVVKEEIAKANTADPNTLLNFMNWSKTNYPAKNYAIVLMNHGGGTMEGIFQDTYNGTALGYNGNDANTMTLLGLDYAFSKANIHFREVIFDACLMQTLEVVQTIGKYTDYIVGSETSTYIHSFQFLNKYKTGKDIEPVEFAKDYASCYVEQMRAYNDDYEKVFNTNCSIVDCSKIEPVTKVVNDMLYKVAENINKKENFLDFASALDKAPLFEPSKFPNNDLYQFLNSFEKTFTNEDINKFNEAFKELVIYNVCLETNAKRYGLAFTNLFYMDYVRASEYALIAPQNKGYLVLLDALLLGWSAPLDVYETYERVEEINHDKYYVDVYFTKKELYVFGGMDAIKSVTCDAYYKGADNHYYAVAHNLETKYDDLFQTFSPDPKERRVPTYNGVPIPYIMAFESDNHLSYYFNAFAVFDGYNENKIFSFTIICYYNQSNYYGNGVPDGRIEIPEMYMTYEKDGEEMDGYFTLADLADTNITFYSFDSNVSSKFVQVSEPILGKDLVIANDFYDFTDTKLNYDFTVTDVFNRTYTKQYFSN